VYVNEACSTEPAKDLLACINGVLEKARARSPNLQVEIAPSIKTGDGDSAEVRILSGAADARQAREALAFVRHDEVTVLVVLTTKDPSRWTNDYAAFERILAGHRYFDCKSLRLAVSCSR